MTTKTMDPVENVLREAATASTERLVIAAPNYQTAQFLLVGTAPYVQLRFSQKALETMRSKQAAGDQAKKGRKRDARDFDADYEASMYADAEGNRGIPASAFRNALIRACSNVGFKMTAAKMSVFVLADTVDRFDGTQLVTIHGTPEKVEHAVRNATGVADIRVRAMWRQWEATLRVRFNGDQFTSSDVANLLMHAGISVGVGEGRPFSKESAGMGWGTFEVAG